MHAATSLATRNEPMTDEPPLDTEGEFSAADYVSFEYHGGRVRGYIFEFVRDSYLFADRYGNIRPYARVVVDWDRRHLPNYGFRVLLTELTLEDNL